MAKIGKLSFPLTADTTAFVRGAEKVARALAGEPARLVAVCSGGDWADASVCHVVVPKGVDMDEAKREYDEWYAAEFRSGRAEYRTFPTWLIEHMGAREASEEDVEEFWEL